MLADFSNWWFAPFGGFYFFSMAAIAILGVSMINKKKENRRRARDKVIELRSRGMKASICPDCDGSGDSWWGDCSTCDGIGYTCETPTGG